MRSITDSLVQTRVNGVELEYVDEGTGVPVVFSHGGSSDLRPDVPMPASPATRTIAPAPDLRRVERALPELPELAHASDEDVARASIHLGRIAARPSAGEGS